MPQRLEHDRDHRVRRVVITCDVCRTEVDDNTIMKSGGLLEMGWKRQFNEQRRRNEYFCPKHN